MLSKTKHSIAVAAVLLAAASPTALAADGGDPGASPSQSAPQSAQAETGGGSWSGGYHRHCYHVRYGGSWRWRCVWR